MDCLEIIKSCTKSDNSISSFFSFPISDKIINHVTNFYEITDENKEEFIQSNLIFANLCKSSIGFTHIFNKIGLERLLTIAKNTCDIDILSAIMDSLVTYIQNQNDFSEIIGDLLTIIGKCILLTNRTSKLMTNCYLLSGIIYSQEISEYFDQLGIKLLN